MALSRTLTCCRSTKTVIVSPSAILTTLPSRLLGSLRRTQVRSRANIRGHPICSVKDAFGRALPCSSIIEASMIAGCLGVNLIAR